MQYEIFTRGDQRSDAVRQRLIELLGKTKGFACSATPEIVITIGGDGTFLRAVQHYLSRLEQVTFVGVHTGTLGFFCDYNDTELATLVTDLPRLADTAHSYRLLELRRYNHENFDVHYAVNEIRLENPFHTLVSDVFIDGVPLETFRGNGLIVASTLGASGYNKSLGGALIDTRLETLQLTEVATLQNNAFRSLGSSLVLNADQTIRLEGHFANAVIGYDHVVLEQQPEATKLEIQLSGRRLRVVHQNKRQYIEILRKSFIKD